MFATLARAGLAGMLFFVASLGVASAETSATPTPAPKTVVAQSSTQANPTPTPDPLTFSGYYRAYYFTRQNASNNPGAQFNFSPGAKYNSNGVNQATFNMGIQLHSDYHFAGGGWYVGGGYFYANPLDGPCVVPANHTTAGAATSNVISCSHQTPPNTNADDTLPGFTLSTFDEAYIAYKDYGVAAKVGDQIINTPWANPDLSRLKADAFQGADVAYSMPDGVNFDAMDMIAFQNRDSSAFQQTTLITGYPAGNPGLPANFYYPGGNGKNTAGFFMGKVGYATPSGSQGNPWSANGYLYAVSDISNIYWVDAKYTFKNVKMHPYVAFQGGYEQNAGASYVGKIDSTLTGLQLGANVTKNVLVTGAVDYLPWHQDTVALPKGVTCDNTNYQIKASPGATLAYWLPSNAGQCYTNTATGLTQIEYGGWASPYTDGWATDPVFTTQMTQGIVDRRAAGTSYKIAATFTSNNQRVVFLVSNAWYNLNNAIAAENSRELDIDGRYYFSQVKPNAPYHGLLLRERYGDRNLSNTYFPYSAGAGAYLGGLPVFKYNRSQLEYDF